MAARASASETMESNVDDVASCQTPHLREAALRVAANVQAEPGAGLMQPIHQPLLEGPDEFIVEARADEGGGGIADADEISAGLHLRAAEGDGELQREFEKVPDEGGVVVKIEHQAVDAAQIRGCAAGAFHPAFDDALRSGAGAQLGEGEQAVTHVRGRGRIGHAKAGKDRLVGRRERSSLRA